MNLSNPIYWQQQYAKVAKKIKKACQSGKFNQFSTFKQHQLIDKLTTSLWRLKKLGMTAAVVTGLGLATPAVGQLSHSFTATTHLDSLDKADGAVFVDLDTDGDLDIVMFHTYYNYVNYGNENYYYENVGSDYRPIYIERTALLNSLNINHPTFVDIDGDGDLDCFAGTMSGYNFSGDKCTYFENVGTATVPAFIQRPPISNPLDSINQHTNANDFNYGSAFADIDSDGDYDYFIYRIISGTVFYRNILDYYENIGTDTNPNFIRRLNTANPLNTFITSNHLLSYGSPTFIDEDYDGDLDVLIGGEYYENRSNASAPSFLRRTGIYNPYHELETYLNASQSNFQITNPVLVNFDGNMSIDMSCGQSNRSLGYRVYYEGLCTYCAIPTSQQLRLPLRIAPNPTTGYIQLERPLTGVLEIFNTAGQVVDAQLLNDASSINLSNLTNGIYFLKMQTMDGLIHEKVVVSK